MSQPSQNLFGWPDKVGLKGDRKELTLTFVKRRKFLRGFTMYRYEFTDSNGNIFHWNTDSDKGLVTGHPYTLTATISGHGNDGGIPVTKLKGCRFAA